MTDPTPQTTPTRDEAVADDERRIDLPNGYYLFQMRPSDMTCSLHMPDGLHIGNLLAQYAGADFAAAMLASAPAPASGGADAVLNLYREAVRIDVKMEGPQFMGANSSALKRAWEADRASLSPAATPVSEAGGEPDMRRVCEALGFDPTNHHNAAKCPYCNPDQADAPKLTYRSTQATTCASCGEHKHTPLRRDEMGGYVCLTCIDKRLAALAKPASSPAGGDVREALRILDQLDRQNAVNDRYASDLPKAERHTSELWLICNSHVKDRARELRATLSQSTSAGRVGE